MAADPAIKDAASLALPPPYESEAEAIFVVGVSRSGTTLLRRLLETSKRIGVAHENHFMGHIVRREGARYYFRRLGDLEDDATIHRLVQFIYSGEYNRRSRVREPSHYWTWLMRSVPAEAFEARLLAGERTERGILRAMMREYADFYGRAVMGEKSPPHLWYAETLLDWFPGARVIHMIRDPRAVYVSEIRRRRVRPKKPYRWIMKAPGLLEMVMLAQTTVIWRSAERQHRVLQEHAGSRYMLVRFEDLVRKPEATLPKIFAFIGVEQPAHPTEVRVVSDGFRSGETGLDRGAADRWHEQISPLADRWLRLFLGSAMRRVGYLV